MRKNWWRQLWRCEKLERLCIAGNRNIASFVTRFQLLVAADEVELRNILQAGCDVSSSLRQLLASSTKEEVVVKAFEVCRPHWKRPSCFVPNRSENLGSNSRVVSSASFHSLKSARRTCSTRKCVSRWSSTRSSFARRHRCSPMRCTKAQNTRTAFKRRWVSDNSSR